MAAQWKGVNVGDSVTFKYRSGKAKGGGALHGTVTRVERGATAAASKVHIRPAADSRHKGEPQTIVRHGDKVRRR